MNSTTPSEAPRPADVEAFLRGLQNRICAEVERIDGQAKFLHDAWQRDPAEGGGGGESRVLSDGAVFERAGVNFSDIRGTKLPPAATAARPELVGRGFRAMGVSLVFHPRNPYAPTTHANVRFLVATNADGTSARAEKEGEEPVWWFGGGFDLTPYYGFHDDAVHWHQLAKDACTPFGPQVYPQLKAQCDDYFFLKHRNEARGIGGLFYDDWSVGGFDASFALMQSVGDHFMKAYGPIIERRHPMPYTQRERDWQLYRRGRYVEFNLVWDRGTLFGLQSKGRIESILMSMPPLVTWHYNHQPEPDSPEAVFLRDYLPARDWLS